MDAPPEKKMEDIPVAMIVPNGDVEPEEEHAGSGFFYKLVRNYNRYSLVVIIIWVLVIGIGVWAIPQCLQNFNSNLVPIKGSDSETAKNKMDSVWPQPKAYEIDVALWPTDTTSFPDITKPPILSNLSLSTYAILKYAAKYPVINSTESYITFVANGYPTVARGFVSPDGSHTIIRLVGTEIVNTNEFITDLVESLPSLLAPGISGGATGGAVVSLEGNLAVEADIIGADIITIPISLAILAWVLRSCRLILITILMLIASICGAFALVLPLTNAAPVPSWTLSLMIATQIAISFDYSLFHLTALQIELKKPGKKQMVAIVEVMMESVSHTILVSGLTLAACFLSLAFFPVSDLRYPGISTAIAVFVTVACNLSLLPCLLLLFPRYFSHANCNCCRPAYLRMVDRLKMSRTGSVQPDDKEKESWTADMSYKWWHSMSVFVQRWKFSVVFAVLALLLCPFAPWLPDFDYTLDWAAGVPKSSEALRNFRALRLSFGAQMNAGTTILGIPKVANQSVLSQAIFNETQSLIASILTLNGTVAESAAFVGGRNVSVSALTAALARISSGNCTCNCPGCTPINPSSCPENVCIVAGAASGHIKTDGSAITISVRPYWETTSELGLEWAGDGRDIITAYNTHPLGVVQWYWVPDGSLLLRESVDYVYSFFPTFMGATAVIVFGLLTVAFRSVVVAIRAVISITVIVAATFGAATAIFTDGVLNSGSEDVLSSQYGGVFWLMPVLAFAIMVGLGLDYDIFLMTRIEEERHAGWTDTSSLVVGVSRSGPIISWAGVIMAVAFAGYFKASLPLLNQLSFYIVFAVLIDTFIVRSLLVPATMGILQSWNWWPMRSRFPEPTKELPEFEQSPPNSSSLPPPPSFGDEKA